MRYIIFLNQIIDYICRRVLIKLATIICTYLEFQPLKTSYWQLPKTIKIERDGLKLSSNLQLF